MDHNKLKHQSQLDEVNSMLSNTYEELVARAKYKLTEGSPNDMKNYHHIMSILQLKQIRESTGIQDDTRKLQQRMNTYTKWLILFAVLMLISSIINIFTSLS